VRLSITSALFWVVVACSIVWWIYTPADPPRAPATTTTTVNRLALADINDDDLNCLWRLSDGRPQASGTLTNRSPDVQDYWVFVDFTDEQGEPVGEAIAGAVSIAPDETVSWRTAEPTGDEVSSAAGCEVTRVERQP
jgi:hypothetical protein